MTTFFKWTKERRENFEVLVKEGYSIPDLMKLTHYSRYLIESELKRGLTEEEFKSRRFVKYRATKAAYTEAKTVLGDNFELLLQELEVN